MDNDYWEKKSSSVILTKSFRQTPPIFTPKKIIKVTKNLSSLCQLRPLTILSSTTSLPRSLPLSSLSNLDNCYSNTANIINLNKNRYKMLQDFQFVNNHDNSNDSLKKLQFANKDEEYLRENNEKQQTSRSFMRQMISMYNKSNDFNYVNKDKCENVDNKNCKYIVKMTPRPYQYYQQQSQQQQPNQQQLIQTSTNQYYKIPKISGMSNETLKSSSSSSSLSSYSPSSVSVHHQSSTINSIAPLIINDYQVHENSLNDFNNSRYNLATASSTEMMYETIPNNTNNTSKIISTRKEQIYDKNYSNNYIDEYNSLACGSYSNENQSTNLKNHNSKAFCAVCGDGHAKLHYGVLACYGCKGFFRRTLTGRYQYACRFGNNCVVDKYQRNSCRFCRFKRCIDVGMDPKAVRPDRDLTGKQRVPRTRKRQIDEELINHIMRLQGDDWSRKIPVEAKVLLMQLLNIESKVSKGDLYNNTSSPAMLNYSNNLNENHDNSKKFLLRDLFEQKPALSECRTEMCYKPYNMAQPEELPRIAYRSALAAVDWIELLADIGNFCDTNDKIALVKSCYVPLTIFNFSAQTAQNTKDPDILCLCSYSYIPRKLPLEFNVSNHFTNVLIDRTLNELVLPLRKLNLREEEVIPLMAIIILNPNAKGLSAEAQQRIAELRDRTQDMLFQIVKEMHPAYNASSRFGNLLLLLPTISTLSGVISENMQFPQVFGNCTENEPLLNELFENCADKHNSVLDEPLITSSTSTWTPSPLFENPADISLESIMFDSSNFTTKISNNYEDKNDVATNKFDGFIETKNQKLNEQTNFLEHYSGICDDSNCCSSPIHTNLASTAVSNFYNSINNDFLSPTNSNNQIDDDSLLNKELNSFTSSFDENNLLNDCELADSSTFSLEIAAQLFESNVDLFELIE